MVVHIVGCLAISASLGCASLSAPQQHHSTAVAASTPCSIVDASPWLERWLGAWELTSRETLRLQDAPAPELVFFDGSCVYTTSAVAAGGAAPVDGPDLPGHDLPWRALRHDGSITLPEGSEVPVQLLSFASTADATGPFFVMAAPALWKELGNVEEPGLTGVFLHELAHTRQVKGMGRLIGPIDEAWPFEEELTDDAVQHHFSEDPEYVEAYLAERDLLYRAADAGSVEEASELAEQALEMMRARHARWFTGDRAIFADVDRVFLAMEGVGQWTAYSWLAHPEGGALAREEAMATMLGRRRWWTQDEGLALLLVVDRLYPEWPRDAFGDAGIEALEMLEKAVAASQS